MTATASKASAPWAKPAALVRLSAAAFMLVALSTAARASEGADVALPIAAPTVAAAAPIATAAPPAVAPPTATAQAPRRAAVPAPAPLPRGRGPVWTDASGTWRQDGVASWYGGKRWQGRRTASGIRYDDRQMVAAHASLPMGSRIRVTVADTGRTVVVTIVDRPGTRARIIDLSRAAAIQLGILSRGVARVSLAPA